MTDETAAVDRTMARLRAQRAARVMRPVVVLRQDASGQTLDRELTMVELLDEIADFETVVGVLLEQVKAEIGVSMSLALRLLIEQIEARLRQSYMLWP